MGYKKTTIPKSEKKLTALIGCEESQAVCIEFRKLGHEAFSCDLLPCSGGHPEWHLQMDVFEAIKLKKWDLMIAFPPCTHLCSSGAVYWDIKQKDGRQQDAIDFFMCFFDVNCKYIAVENPAGIISRVFRKPDQYINPYYFGDPYRKRTGLWLKNLPLLNPTNIITPIASWHSGSTRGGIKKDGTRTKSKLPALKSGSILRSKTFPGIAQALAFQYSNFIISGISIKEWDIMNI